MGFITISNGFNMCYISVSMDVNGAVIQERVTCMKQFLLQSLVESQEITSHTKDKHQKSKLEKYNARNVKEEKIIMTQIS